MAAEDLGIPLSLEARPTVVAVEGATRNGDFDPRVRGQGPVADYHLSENRVPHMEDVVANARTNAPDKHF